MRNIRRQIITEIAGSPQKQKAVAFALLLKERTNDSSVVRNFSIYKIQKMTSMAYKTIKKYLGVLIKMGFAELKDDTLFLKRMASSSKHKNIDISKITLDKTKNVFNQIRELVFLLIQANKDYIKSLLRLRKNPVKGVNYKTIRRLCKKCCKNPYADYKESGISYACVAERVGCCKRTAFSVVKDAVKRKWCTKKNNCESHLLVNVNFRSVPGYTYTTRHHGIILRSNTYRLSRVWSRALACAPIPALSRAFRVSCASSAVGVL